MLAFALAAIFLCLLGEGHWVTSSSRPNDASDLIEALFDYLLSLLRFMLPEPLTMNKSPKGMINVENASIYGLSNATRGCPMDLNVYSTPAADHISGILCIDLKNFFKIDAIFQISTFFYDSNPNPSTLQLFNFKVRLNLTLTLPKIYQENSGALIKLDGIPTVEISRLKFIQPPDADISDDFDFLTDLAGALSAGPLGGYIEMRIGEAIQKALKELNKSLEKNVAKLAKPRGL